MYVRKGNTRIVIAFPKMGFVIKIAKICIFGPLKWFIQDIIHSRGSWKRATLTWRLMGVENRIGPKFPIVGGIMANWHERKKWRLTKHKFLCPTFFTFLGLFNIQKFEKPLEPDGLHIGALMSRITNCDSQRCGHGFENAENYCNKDGHLQMIDYGDSRQWPVIEKYAEKILLLTEDEFIKKTD